MQRYFAAFAALTMILLAAACDGSGPSAPSPVPSPPPTPAPTILTPGDRIIVGVSVARSGEQAVVGQDLANAVDLAIRDFGRPIKGYEVTVQAEDDGCNDPEKAAAAAERLASTLGAVGVIGPMCTTGAQAANDVYEAAALVHISPSATRNDLSAQGERFFFRTAWRDDAQSKAQVSYAREVLFAEDFTVIDDGEPYGKTLADALVAEIEESGGLVSSRERIRRGATDFSSLARQIVTQQPDAVVFEGFDPEGALVLRALRDAGYTGAFIGPDSLLNLRDFVGTAAEAAEGAIVTGGLLPDQAFIDRFAAAYGHPPATSFVLQAYDATRILLTGIEAVAVENENGGLVIDPALLAEALRAQSFAGLTGTLRFDAQGDRTDATAREAGLAVYRVSGGVFEQVDVP